MKTSYVISAILLPHISPSFGWAFRAIASDVESDDGTMIPYEDEPYHGVQDNDGTTLFESAQEVFTFLTTGRTWGPGTELDIDTYTNRPKGEGPHDHYTLTINYDPIE